MVNVNLTEKNNGQTQSGFAGSQGRIASVLSAQKVASDNGATPQTTIGTYTVRLGGKDYSMTTQQASWIKNRYSADVLQYDPTEVSKTYTGSSLDTKLKTLGLPSSKSILKYMSAYTDWYGDGSTYQFDSEAKTAITKSFKDSWEYEYTLEDQQRKAKGLMPTAIEAKYGDTLRDSQLYEQGLPPESMLTTYVEPYVARKKQDARIDEFYGAVTQKWVTDEAQGKTDEAAKEAAFFDTLKSSEWADVAELYKKRETASDATYASPFDQYEAEITAQNKAAKTEGDPFVSYDDFASKYLEYKKPYLEAKLTDEAAYALGASTLGGAIEQRNKESLQTIAQGDRAGVVSYVQSRKGDDPAAVLADLYNAGASLTRLRNAQDALIDANPDSAKAIRASFKEYQLKYREDRYSAAQNATDSWWGDGQTAARSEAGKKRREQNRIFKEYIDTPYKEGSTSTMSVGEATTVFKSHLIYDKNGKVSTESVEAATKVLSDAGVSAPIIKKVTNSTLGTAGDKFSLSDAMISMQSADTIINFDKADTEARSVDVKDRTAIAESARKRLVGGGTMTDFEFDQMLRRNGWGDAVSDVQAAKDYFVESEYPKFAENSESAPVWKALSAEEKNTKANEQWNAMGADSQAAYTASFVENAPFNTEIHKSWNEQIEGQGIGGIFAKAYIGTLAGAVGILDMATGGAKWEASNILAQAAGKASAYNRSNQSAASTALGLASDISSEILRMYALNAAGSGIASMFSGANSAIAAVSATATSATTKGLNALARAGMWVVKSTPFIATSMGQYYNEAIQSGATVPQATVYGIVCGALEGATEAANTSMWIERGFGAGTFAKELISGGNLMKAGSVVMKARVVNLVASALGEFAEESASYVGSVWMQRATYNKGAKFDITEMLKQGGMGALIGLFGAGASIASYDQSGIISQYLDTEAGMKWATGEGSSAVRDLMFSTLQAESIPADTLAMLQMQDGALSIDDYDAVVRDIDQHSRQMDSDSEKYDTDMAKIDAEVSAKQSSVDALTERVTEYAADSSPEGVKQWGKAVEALRVAQSELDVETAQATQKRTERTAAFTETTSQHRTAMAKAQARVLGHSVSMADAFRTEIKGLKSLTESGSTTMTTKLGQEILYKMDAARAGKLADYMEAYTQNAAVTAAGGAGAAQTPTGGNVVMFGQNDAESTPVSPVVAGEQAGLAGKENLAIHTMSDWTSAFGSYNPQYVAFNAIQGWFEKADSAERPSYAVVFEKTSDGERAFLIPSDNNLLLSDNVEKFFDVSGTSGSDSYVMEKMAPLEKYGAHFRLSEKGSIRLSVKASEQQGAAQPANVARSTAGAKAVESLNDRAIEMERQPLSFSKEEMPFVDSAVKAVSSISAEVGTDIKSAFPYAKSIVGMDYVAESMQDIALRVLNGDAEYLDGENLTRQIERVIGTVRIDFVPTEVGLLGHDGAEIRDIRNQIRKTKISIGAYTATGFKYSVDDSIRTDKSLFGTIRLSKSGTAQSADALYYELSNAYPDLFDQEVMNPSDQIRVMADFVRMTYNGRAESLSKIKSGEYVYYLARDVAEKFVVRTMDSYFGVASLRNENGGKADGEAGAVESATGIVAETRSGSTEETERNEAGTGKNQGSAKVSQSQNPAEPMADVGITAGAMRSTKGLSDGQVAVSQFYENTLAWMDSDEASTAVRDAGQAFDESFTYDVVSEKESIAKAQEKLARGITPELLEALRIKNAWTGVDVDVAMGIKEFYRNQGVSTGDYTDYLNWSMLIADRVGENARALQALAKYSRDAKEMALALAQKNVKKAEKNATPKQKEKIERQKKEVGKAVDKAVKTKATPDAVEETVQKIVEKQTARSIKNAFIDLQNGKIDRAAFDSAVSDSIKEENGLPVFTAENAKRVIELLDQADQQTDEYERKKYTSMAAKIIANAQGVSFIDKFRSFQRIMMLLNPRTMVRNVVANVVFTPLEWLKDVPTTLADMIASKVTGERTTTVSIEKVKAWAAGLKRGGSEVGKDVKNKVNTSRSGKYEITNKDVWKSHFLQMLDNLAGYGLNAGDRPFYEAAFDEFMMNEQLLGHDTESEEVNQRVVALALDRVFQGNPKLNEVLKGLRNSLDKTGIPIGTLLLPFTQTPANLADKLLEYSPAGLIEAAVQLGKAKSTGVFDQKQFVDRVGRSITGTGLMILGYVLAKAGVINMAGDDDKERQAMKNAGVSAYSIQLGDTSISINWAEPIGSIIIMGATLAKMGANSESLNALQAIWGGSKMLINSFFSNTVLSNVASLFGAGYGDVASGLESFALGSSTQFLPSALAAIARTLDPYERDTYDPNVFLQQGKRILSYFPGLRQLLPFKYGTDGKPVESNYGDTFFDRVFNTMVNPALVDTKSGDPVNDEIYRLYQSGFTDQLLPLAGKTLGNQKLTAEQRREYQRVLGEASYNAAMRVIGSGGYASLTDEQKVDALNDAIGDAADDAREGFKQKNGLN